MVTGALGHLKSSPPELLPRDDVAQGEAQSLALVSSLGRCLSALATPDDLSGRGVGGTRMWEGAWPGCGETPAGCHKLPVPGSLVLQGHSPVGCLPVHGTPHLSQCSFGGLEQGPGDLL